jgi:hypothetical protein
VVRVVGAYENEGRKAAEEAPYEQSKLVALLAAVSVGSTASA